MLKWLPYRHNAFCHILYVHKSHNQDKCVGFRKDKHISVIGLYRNAMTLPLNYAFVVVTVRLQVIQYPSAKDTPF